MPKLALHRTVAVSTTALELLPENPSRKYALIVNDGNTYPLYIGFGPTGVATTTGIRVNINGGNYEITNDNPWTGSIWAIAAGSTSIRIVEW